MAGATTADDEDDSAGNEDAEDDPGDDNPGQGAAREFFVRGRVLGDFGDGGGGIVDGKDGDKILLGVFNKGALGEREV